MTPFDLRSQFYESRAEGNYPSDHDDLTIDNHYYGKTLREFVSNYSLANAKCLEIGCGKGIFQDLVDDYWGVDVSESLRKHHLKHYILAQDSSSLPFADGTFDAVWSLFVHEHIVNLEQCLIETRRVLKPGGLFFYAPAWQCRSWLSQGYNVRPYSDLRLHEKLVKLSIPLRDNIAYRIIKTLPGRLLRQSMHMAGIHNPKLSYRRLNANYYHFWGPDSDACNSLDPHASLIWFLDNGFRCLNYQTSLHRLTVRTGPLILAKI